MTAASREVVVYGAHQRTLVASPLLSSIATATLHLMIASWVIAMTLPQVPGLRALANDVTLCAVVAQIGLTFLIALARGKMGLARGTAPVLQWLWLLALVRIVSLVFADRRALAVDGEIRFVLLALWATQLPLLLRLVTPARLYGVLSLWTMLTILALVSVYLTASGETSVERKTALFFRGFRNNVDAFSVFCLTMLAFATGRLAGVRRWWELFLVTGAAATMLLSLARSAFLLLLGAFAGRIWSFLTLSRARVAIVVLAAVVIAVGASTAWLIAGGLSVARTIEMSRGSEAAALSTGRVVLWGRALADMRGYELTGHGGRAGDVLAAGTLSNFQRADEGVVVFPGGLHNAYLSALYEYGPAGLLVLLVLLTQLVRCARRLDRATGNWWLLGLWGGIIARGFVEIQGLTGRGNGVADYVVFLAIGITLTSAEVRADRPPGEAAVPTS